LRPSLAAERAPLSNVKKNEIKAHLITKAHAQKQILCVCFCFC
jgi:hypothetical protein